MFGTPVGVTPVNPVIALYSRNGGTSYSLVSASPAVEPGVNVWLRELHEHTHSDDTFSTVAVAEPFVRFHFGAVKPSVSVILPFAGDLADAKTFGVRVGITGEL